MFDRNTANFSVSMFYLPDYAKEGLAHLSTRVDIDGAKQSINNCILDSLEWYFGLPEDQQIILELPKASSKHFSVRMPKEAKLKLMQAAAVQQLKMFKQVPMSAVLNTALVMYLQKELENFQVPSLTQSN